MKKLLLFDVDGTLCESGKKITQHMLDIINELNDKHDLGIVGGGVYTKLYDQIPEIWRYFKYVCGDNGNDIYRKNKNIYTNDIRTKWDMETITKINEILLLYTAKNKQIKVKTGKFINLRKGLIYYVPIGHDCTIEERNDFIKNDIRLNIIHDIQKLLAPIVDVNISLGGELGLAIYPKGWGKKIVLDYIDKYDTIVFFGDKICPYGNDLDIAESVDKYHSVSSYKDTICILEDEYL